MRTIRVKLYKFNELNERAQQKAIEYLSDINVDFEWWDFIYEDAERIGLIIEGFDLDRRTISANLSFSLTDSCTKILGEHGETCDTYKLATEYMQKWADLVKKFSDGIHVDRVSEENETEFDNEADQLESEFLHDLKEEYILMLVKEYEYKTSKEAIIESIKANEYEFTQDGRLH